MNGHDHPELFAPDDPQDEPEEMQYERVRQWAQVQRELKQSSAAILKAHGLTWVTFKDLEELAAAECPDTLETEYGTVQKIPDLPVQYRIRKSPEDTAPTMTRKRLRLKLNEEEGS